MTESRTAPEGDKGLPDIPPDAFPGYAAVLALLDPLPPPATEPCPDDCNVVEWDYEWLTPSMTTAVHPRAVGRCSRCGTVYVVQLPRQRFWRDYWGALFDRGRREVARAEREGVPVVREALNQIQSERFASKRLADAFRDSLPVANSTILTAIRREIERVVRAELEEELQAAARQRQMAFEDRMRLGMRTGKRALRRAERIQQIVRALDPAVGQPLMWCPEVTDVVYGLADPRRPDRVRYVGRTRNPTGRYLKHLAAGAPLVRAWLQILAGEDVDPLMLCLERCLEQESGEREAHWIHHYRRLGQADLNSAIPGAPEC